MDLKQVPVSAFGQTKSLVVRENTVDERVISEVFEAQQYNMTAYPWWPRVKVPDRPLIIDAGAHVGVASVYFSMMLPNAMIMAIEPHEENFHVLLKNSSGSPSAHLSPIYAAVGGERGWGVVQDPGEGTWGYRVQRSQGAGPNMVPIKRMAEFCTLTSPFLVKIDIEGGEIDLLSANTDWIDRASFIIIELHEWLVPGCQAAWDAAVAGRGRHQITHGTLVVSVRKDVWDSLEIVEEPEPAKEPEPTQP